VQTVFGGRWPTSQLFGPVVARGPADGDRVALTFDDGPNPAWTPALLDLLAAIDVRATFFVIGKWAEREPRLLRELVEAGHALGNHTYSHPTLPKLRAGAVAHELARCRAAVEAARVEFSRVGGRMLMRPPYGRRRPGTIRAIRAQGYLPVTWSVSGRDWLEGETPDSIASRCLAAAAGDVVLLHDGRRTEPPIHRGATVAATGLVVQGLAQRGLEPVTLPELLAQNGSS
jgi:peptidoglycan/xylan/chitin deacetylase (PgdA/CDA1 family)